MELVGKLSAAQGLSANLSSNVFRLQAKSVEPTQNEQVIVADDGYTGLSSVTISPIPSNYGRVIYNGILTIV